MKSKYFSLSCLKQVVKEIFIISLKKLYGNPIYNLRDYAISYIRLENMFGLTCILMEYYID